MDFKLHFDHYNINVADRDRSINFYAKALGLKESHHINAADGSFTITYLTDGVSPFLLEITCMKNHPQPYDLGENETHLALRLSPAQDFEAVRAYHRELGIICYENHDMGIYFIEDPDGYWIEILPPR
ncbi:MAG: VOC family protein [Staphylococcus sp.]|nr:VOC family protein [Staphylococcus sp.]